LQFLYRGAYLLTAFVFGLKNAPSQPKPKAHVVKRVGSHLREELLHDYRGRERSAPQDAAVSDDVLPVDEFFRARRWIDARLDIVGDVFNYAALAVQAPTLDPETRGYSEQIENRLREQLIEANDTCDEIQIVAHSLGTVVMFRCLSHAQRAGDSEADWMRKLTRIYTIGCPLEKIRYFWPKLVTTDPTTPPSPQPRTPYEWNNFANPLDLVSGVLSQFHVWGAVTNRRLIGMGGLVTAHGRRLTQKHPVFRQAFVSGVLGHYCPTERHRLERLRSLAWVLVESVGVVVAIVVALAIGMGSIGGPLFLFYGSLTLPVVWSVLGLIFGLHGLGLCLAAYRQATKEHPSYCFGAVSTQQAQRPLNDDSRTETVA
jgi:hypothetical protein